MYIKFDKKLIVDIEKLKYEGKKSKVNSSIEDLKVNIKKLPLLLKYFQEININSLKINNNEFTIFFNEKYLYLDNKHINLSTQIQTYDSNVKLNLYSLYLKDFKILLNGEFEIDMHKEIANFIGNYFYKSLSGEFKIQADEKFIDFYVNTNEVKNIQFVKDFIRLPSEAEKWMYDNVVGKIKLNYFYGKLNSSNFYPILGSFKGNAIIEDAKIKFHNDAKVVNTKKVTVDYKNDKLYFSMTEPSYDTTKIYGSSVVINNLTSEKKGEVVLNIQTKSSLNDDILNILKAYDIILPLIQTKGTTNSNFILTIPYQIKKGIKTTGNFLAKNASFKLQNFEFDVENADIELKNTNVIIKNSYIKYKDMFEGILNLNIDTKALIADGNVNLSKVLIENSSDKIINGKNIKTNVFVDFKNNIVVQFPSLKTKLDFRKENILISLDDLALIYEYSSLLKKLDIKKGNINLELINENNITFKSSLDELNFPIEKDLKPIKKIELEGIIKNENLYVKSTNHNIVLESIKDKNIKLFLKNIDLNINPQKVDTTSLRQSLVLDLENSKIFMNNESYLAKKANINLDSNKVEFQGIFSNLKLPFLNNGKKIDDLEVVGVYTYKNNDLLINTNDEKITLNIKNSNELFLKLKDYDLVFDTTKQNDILTLKKLFLEGKNSNIIINDKYILLSDKYTFESSKNLQSFLSSYKNSNISYSKKNEDFTLKANSLNDKFINNLLNKEIITGGNVIIIASGKNKILDGKVFLNENNIKELSILTNLITIINTSPALINPLLAIPSIASMITNKGFAVSGYKINDGYVDFKYNFDTKYLHMKKIVTVGNGIDFDGKASINFDKNLIDGKINLIFFKGYTSVVSYIPVVNYLLLGDNKRVETEIEISGTLDEPKIKSNVAQDSINAPVNVIKRIITSPIKLFE